MSKTNLKPITVYVTPEDHARLMAEAVDHGVTLSFFCAQLIRQYSPVQLSPTGKQGAPAGNTNRRHKRERFTGI